jgi:hypothetical protein
MKLHPRDKVRVRRNGVNLLTPPQVPNFYAVVLATSGYVIAAGQKDKEKSHQSLGARSRTVAQLLKQSIKQTKCE